MAVLPDPFSIFTKGVWARDYPIARYILYTCTSVQHLKDEECGQWQILSILAVQ